MISPDLQRNFKMFGGKVRLENPWLKVIDYKTKTDERDGRYTVVERKNSVVIVLEHPEHGFLLVKSYRYPIGEALWEFPAGGIEKGETPLAAATRELWEEAGIHVGLREIGSFLPLPGLTSQRVYVFYGKVSDSEAEQILQFKQPVDELLNWRFATHEEIKNLTISQELQCGLTFSALEVYRLNHTM